MPGRCATHRVVQLAATEARPVQHKPLAFAECRCERHRSTPVPSAPMPTRTLLSPWLVARLTEPTQYVPGLTFPFLWIGRTTLRQEHLEFACTMSGEVRPGVVAAELFEQLLVAAHDALTALDLRLRREALAALAHDLESRLGS